MADAMIGVFTKQYREDPSDENAHKLASYLARTWSNPLPTKVVYSPGYGAGWSTWMSNEEDAALAREYGPLVEAVETGEQEEIQEAIRELIPLLSEEPYLGGTEDLRVKEVFGPYFVDEYDGYEHVYQGYRS